MSTTPIHIGTYAGHDVHGVNRDNTRDGVVLICRGKRGLLTQLDKFIADGETFGMFGDISMTTDFDNNIAIGCMVDTKQAFKKLFRAAENLLAGA